jgi:DNA-binding CsgD family transcriptional regulator
MLRQAVAGDDLSPREVEVLRLIALGHTSVEIAAKLQLSRRTVETCRARILHKLRCRTRADLVELALRRHLIGSRRRQQFDRRVHRQVDAHQGSLTRPTTREGPYSTTTGAGWLPMTAAGFSGILSIVQRCSTCRPP